MTDLAGDETPAAVSDEQLAEWERRVEAATDGEWYVQRRGGSPLEVRAAWPDEDLHLASVEYLSDADLIVAARNAFPLLVQALRDARAELAESAEEYHALISRQSDLLTRTVKALRGEPPKLVWWSHHDVPERAAAVVAERDALRAESQRMHSHLAEILAKHSRYRAPAEGRFDCCAECNRGSVSYVPYPCQVRIDIGAALAAPTGQDAEHGN